MANTKDPILGLIEKFSGGGESSPVSLTGIVASVSPMIIQTAGIELDGDNLKINVMLNESGRTLHKGDEVLLIPEADGQTYYILCKLGAVT